MQTEFMVIKIKKADLVDFLLSTAWKQRAAEDLGHSETMASRSRNF